jgi:hypothetical protein
MLASPDPGALLLSEGKPQEAFPLLVDRLVANGDAAAWSNLAICYRQLGRFTEAHNCARFALRIDGRCAPARNCIASAYEDLGMFVTAEVCYQRAVRCDPDNPKLLFNHAQSLMRLGLFEEAWHGWEAGRLGTSYNPVADIDPWMGQSLEGKRILVLKEGGYGDGICFARWLPLLQQMGAKVSFLVWKGLAPLLAAQPWARDIQIIPDSEDRQHDPSEFDYQIPLLSLPHSLGMKTWSDIPPMPKIEDPHGKFYYDAEHSLLSIRAGICWRAEENCTSRKHRSVPVEALEPLSHVTHTRWYSLCPKGKDLYRPDEFTTPEWMTDLTTDLKDWSDTAALIANLDLVISADTAVAHLAAAMGKPTWILLPMRRDWKWGDRCGPTWETTPWYRSAKTFGQDDPISWASVINNVVNELEAM